MVFTEDARDLAKNLSAGLYESLGLPKDTAFDRIDVSNIVDPEYVGIPNILADWAPFLNKNNRCSAILGYSMNWVPKQHDSQPGEAAMKTITLKLIEMGKVSTVVYQILLFLQATSLPSYFSIAWQSKFASGPSWRMVQILRCIV